MALITVSHLRMKLQGMKATACLEILVDGRPYMLKDDIRIRDCGNILVIDTERQGQPATNNPGDDLFDYEKASAFVDKCISESIAITKAEAEAAKAEANKPKMIEVAVCYNKTRKELVLLSKGLDSPFDDSDTRVVGMFEMRPYK